MSGAPSAEKKTFVASMMPSRRPRQRAAAVYDVVSHGNYGSKRAMWLTASPAVSDKFHIAATPDMWMPAL